MLKKILLSAYAYTMCVMPVFAAAPKGHDASHHAESSGGLPQLDPSSFASQAFWLFIVFTFLYFVLARKLLPKISQTIENRTERIQSDLDTAQRLKDEVETVQKAYEDDLAEARGKSTQLYIQAEDSVKALIEKRTADFQEKSQKEISDLEKNINIAREKAMKDMEKIAAEIATEAAEKIIGVRADSDTAKAVVSSIRKAA